MANSVACIIIFRFWLRCLKSRIRKHRARLGGIQSGFGVLSQQTLNPVLQVAVITEAVAFIGPGL